MFKRIYLHLDDYVEVYLATVATLVFTCLIVYQVFMRYVLSSPSSWAEEIASFALAWFVFLSGSYAVRYERHVKFNVPVMMLGRRIPIAQRIIQLLVYFIWLAFLVYMCYHAFGLVDQQIHSGQRAASSRIPMYMVYLGLPFGLLLMSFRVIQHIVRASKDLWRNPNKPIAEESILEQLES